MMEPITDQELLATLRGLRRHIERHSSDFNIIEYHRQTLTVLENLPRIIELVADGIAADEGRL